MSTLANIRTASLAARKARSSDASVLTTVLGELDTKMKSLTPARQLTDDEVIAVVKKSIKSNQEIIRVASEKNPAAAEAAAAEIATLEAFLPRQMGEAELRAFIAERAQAGHNMGQIMKALKDEKGGTYDGRLASTIAKEVLAA